MYNNGNTRRLLEEYFREVNERVEGEIRAEKDVSLTGIDVEELTNYYFDKYCLIEIKEDSASEPSIEKESYMKTISGRDREDGYAQFGDKDFPFEKIIIEIPLEYNETIPTISQYSANTYSASYSESNFDFSKDKITIEFDFKGYRFCMQNDQIASECEQWIRRAREIIHNKNGNIRSGNTLLRSNINNFILERLQKIENDSDLMEMLSKKVNISLKKKQNIGEKVIKVGTKVAIRHMKPLPNQPENYLLDEKTVIEIIGVIEQTGKQLERTPKSFLSLGEEELRDIILSGLNTVFEGSATGESFSNNGKTDIYLRIDKGNILVFECKFWAGKALYHETIDQLRGYLVWRHNFAVMITFARNKNFSAILDQTEEIIKTSSSYISGFKMISETHFVSKHTINGDTKIVQIHHLFFNLFT